MAFVNEYASDADAKAYNLEAGYRRVGTGPQYQYKWTIDRSRDIYLMWIMSGREEFAARQLFVLGWRGTVFDVRLEGAAAGNFKTKSSTNWQLLGLDLPPALEAQRNEIIAMLKEALTVYKVSGIGVPVADHTTCFQF